MREQREEIGIETEEEDKGICVTGKNQHADVEQGCGNETTKGSQKIQGKAPQQRQKKRHRGAEGEEEKIQQK